VLDATSPVVDSNSPRLATRQRARIDTSFEPIARAALSDSAPKVLATIVQAIGSTYRKAGARLLLLPSNTYVGLLTGGCLDSDLIHHAASEAW
jgi:xanthine/CO dehydrogenase XdhC/CoxF family maturation factor